MDVKQYRKRYEAELAKAEKAEPGPDVPFDKEQLAARVNELLAALRDTDKPVAGRVAALQELTALDFLGPRFAPFRADYKQALRAVATARQRRLREKALELLAIEQDAHAQELLTRGLREPKEALVPDAKAIQYLSYDEHADIAPLARDVFKRSKGEAREEALRALATDPKSERLFTRLLRDKSEKASIRAISASGLQSLNPAAFERAARRIVADDSDYDAIRATSLAALAHGREARETPVDPKLVDTVQKLAAETRSPALRSSIRRFLQSTQ
jgi:hypothetical protein